MAIQLRNQTQQTEKPSALAYGVGLPVSDGGAGAIAQAAGQIAGAAGAFVDASKKKDEKTQGAAANSAYATWQTAFNDLESQTRVHAINNDQVSYKKAMRELADLDPNSPSFAVGSFASAQEEGFTLKDEWVNKVSDKAKQKYSVTLGNLNEFVAQKTSTRTAQKEATLDAQSRTIASNRTEQEMMEQMQKLKALSTSGMADELTAGLQEFHDTYITGDTNPNNYLSPEERKLSEDEVTPFNEKVRTSATALYGSMMAADTNLQNNKLALSQVEVVQDSSRAIVKQGANGDHVTSQNTSEFFSSAVTAFNHPSLAQFSPESKLKANLRVQTLNETKAVVSAAIGSTRYAWNPSLVPAELREIKSQLGDPELQKIIGSTAAQTLITDVNRHLDAYTKSPDVSGTITSLASTIALDTTNQSPVTIGGINGRRGDIETIKNTLALPNLKDSDKKILTSGLLLKDVRQNFDLNTRNSRNEVYEFMQANPDLTGMAVTNALAGKLGIDVSEMNQGHQGQLGNYFRGFHKRISEIAETHGEDSYAVRNALGSVNATKAKQEGDAALSVIIDKAQAAVDSGEEPRFSPLELNGALSAYEAEAGEFPGLQLLNEIDQTNPALVPAAVESITKVWGEKASSLFITKYSGDTESPLNRTVAQGMHMAHMSNGNLRQIMEQVAVGETSASINAALPDPTDQQLYQAAINHRNGLASGKVDNYGNSNKVSKNTSDAFGSGRGDTLSQITQAFNLEGNPEGAALYTRRFKGLVVQAINNHTGGVPLTPVDAYRAAMTTFEREISVATAPNGTAILSSRASTEDNNWKAQKIDPEDAGAVMMDSAFRFASAEGHNIAKTLRGYYAVQDSDDDATREYKERMNNYESEEEFLNKVQNGLVRTKVNGVDKQVPAVRLGLSSSDENGNSVRALLLFNPNTGQYRQLTSNKGTDEAPNVVPFKILDKSLHNTITQEQVDIVQGTLVNDFTTALKALYSMTGFKRGDDSIRTRLSPFKEEMTAIIGATVGDDVGAAIRWADENIDMSNMDRNLLNKQVQDYYGD